MAEFTKTYDLAGGSVDIILNRTEQAREIIAAQVETDATFNGTTTTVELIQSNNRALGLASWHALPEAPLSLLVSDSHLLTSFAFTAAFVAIRVTVGDATAGILTFTTNFKD